MLIHILSLFFLKHFLYHGGFELESSLCLKWMAFFWRARIRFKSIARTILFLSKLRWLLELNDLIWELMCDWHFTKRTGAIWAGLLQILPFFRKSWVVQLNDGCLLDPLTIILVGGSTHWAHRFREGHTTIWFILFLLTLMQGTFSLRLI